MALTFAAPCRISGAEKIRRWSAILRAHPIGQLIPNASVDQRGSDMRAAFGNGTYVTSLAVQYGRYPRDEIRRLPGSQRLLATAAFTCLRPFLPMRALKDFWLLDNQPFSTPLYPLGFSPAPLRPGEARRGLLHISSQCEFSLPSRLVWLRQPGTPWTRDNYNDASLEATAGGHWRPLTLVDFPQAADLYDQLYRQKYSTLNPAFTATFFRLLHDHEIVDFQGLVMGGQLVGVIGYYVVDGWLTTPVLGYDHSLPRSLGLYRRLCHRVQLISEEAGLMQHCSAGAGKFKAHRGAQPSLEWIWLKPTTAHARFRLLRQLAVASLHFAQRQRL